MKATFRKRFAKIGLATLLVGSVFSQTVFGAVGGRPANPDPDNPRTRSIFIYTLKAGESKSDQIYLSNNGDTAETVELFAVDGTVSNTGAYTCKQNVEPREDVGAWLKLDKTEVTVESQGSTLVDFTITMPEKVDVGEHGGCIAMQKKDDPGQRTGSIQLTNRPAVRVAVVVPGEIHRKVTIEDFSATGGWDTPNITFGLKNEGNVSADVRVDVDIKDVFGNKVHHNGGQYVVVADTTFGVNYDADYRPFFGGWYKVKASMAYDKRAGTFGINDEGQLLYGESPELTIFIAPSIWFFVLLGALVVAGIIFWQWRRRGGSFGGRAKRSASNGQVMWGVYEVRAGDTLESLAGEHNTTAGKIAMLNKLKAPFKLEVGQKIYLPRNKK